MYTNAHTSVSKGKSVKLINCKKGNYKLIEIQSSIEGYKCTTIN